MKDDALWNQAKKAIAAATNTPQDHFEEHHQAMANNLFHKERFNKLKGMLGKRNNATLIASPPITALISKNPNPAPQPPQDTPVSPHTPPIPPAPPAAMSKGGFVPGQPKVFGDSSKNDVIPAKLSPGEIVIPRSITQAPQAPQKAAQFVQKVQQKSMGGPVGYADGGMIDQAMKLAPLAMMFLSDGGEVKAPISKEGWDKFQQGFSGALDGQPKPKPTPKEQDYAEGGQVDALTKQALNHVIDPSDSLAKGGYVGFSKLQGMLAKKGAEDPAALAASIGRKKYGKDKMEKAAKEHKPVTKVKK